MFVGPPPAPEDPEGPAADDEKKPIIGVPDVATDVAVGTPAVAEGVSHDRGGVCTWHSSDNAADCF